MAAYCRGTRQWPNCTLNSHNCRKRSRHWEWWDPSLSAASKLGGGGFRAALVGRDAISSSLCIRRRKKKLRNQQTENTEARIAILFIDPFVLLHYVLLIRCIVVGGRRPLALPVWFRQIFRWRLAVRKQWQLLASSSSYLVSRISRCSACWFSLRRATRAPLFLNMVVEKLLENFAEVQNTTVERCSAVILTLRGNQVTVVPTQ